MRHVWTKTRDALEAGEPVAGRFAPAGTALWTPGSLTWSADNGAEVRLIGASRDWPTELPEHDQVVHAKLEDGSAVTLMESGVSTASLGRLGRMRAAILALGDLVTPATRWTRAIYGTAHLNEWIGEPGLESLFDEDNDFAFQGMRIGPREKRPLSLRRADARLCSTAEPGPIGYLPDWHVHTDQTLVVDVRRTKTMQRLFDDYAVPLASLMAFAAAVIRDLLLESEQLGSRPRCGFDDHAVASDGVKRLAVLVEVADEGREHHPSAVLPAASKVACDVGVFGLVCA